MAEIFQFPDRKPKPKEEANSPAQEGMASPEGDVVSVLMPMVLFLTTLKRSDPRSFNPVNIQERRRVLATLSNEDIERDLRAGNQFSWKERPSWYHALLAEVRNRDMIPESYAGIVDLFDKD